MTKDSPTAHYSEMKQAIEFVAALKKKEAQIIINFSAGPVKKLLEAVVEGNMKAFQNSLRSIP